MTDVVSRGLLNHKIWKIIQWIVSLAAIGTAAWFKGPWILLVVVPLLFLNRSSVTIPDEHYGNASAWSEKPHKKLRKALNISPDGKKFDVKFESNARGVVNKRGFIAITSFGYLLLITPRRYWILSNFDVHSGPTSEIELEHRHKDRAVSSTPWRAEVVGDTWTHTTKDGNRDYRFKHNPVLRVIRERFARISFPTGEKLEFGCRKAEDVDTIVAEFEAVFEPNEAEEPVPILDFIGEWLDAPATPPSQKPPASTSQNPLRPKWTPAEPIMQPPTDAELRAFRRVTELFDKLAGSTFSTDMDKLPRDRLVEMAEEHVALCISEFGMPRGGRLGEYMDKMEEELRDAAPTGAVTARSQAQIEKPRPKQEDLSQLLLELEGFVGAGAAKAAIRSLVAIAQVNKARAAIGLPIVAQTYHLVFTGSPGTGKTTMARLLARIFLSLGYLSKGHLVEVDRSHLVAEYLGQTAVKTSEAVTSAIGGVLFIDEAYSLSDGDDSYGREAISTLLKIMEDKREDLIVIVAGYSEHMELFLASNPGLRSRFRDTLNFEDHEDLALVDVFEALCAENGFKVEAGAESLIKNCIELVRAQRGSDFGNAREARKLFEVAIEEHSLRLTSENDFSPGSLSSISKSDIDRVLRRIQLKALPAKAL